MNSKNSNFYSVESKLTNDSTTHARLYTSVFATQIKLFVYSVCLFLVASIFIPAYLFNLTFREFVPTILIVSSFIVLFIFLAKSIRFASIKEDMIIFNDIWGNSKVTAIKSIQNVKTRRFFSFQWSSVNYNLDGKNQKSKILSNRDKNAPQLDDLIKAHFTQRKNKKANHKPGSVITQRA